jgi:hypothetical protein
MKFRSVVAVASVAALVLVGCGGDEPAGLSDADFADEVADICSDTERELDRIDEPEGLAEVDDAAADAIEVLTDTRRRLAEIDAPSGAADDFEELVENVDDQLAAVEDLQRAAADNDEPAAELAAEELSTLNQRRSDLGQALGIDDCVNDDDEPTDPPSTVADTELTLPATLPPQTAAPETAPPATESPATAPPETTPATTMPPATVPANGQLFTVVDLTTVFVAPDGFTLVDSEAAAKQPFIDIVASVPELNSGIEEMGVGVLLNDSGEAVATLVVGVAVGDAMPAQWKDIICTSGPLRTSANGFTGIVCQGEPGSDVYEFFTLTQDDLGLSVASLIEGVPADLIIDAFFEANSN